ncbi:MAG: porin family protein [Oleibacter sp.]|nr:porin family protein [Thalassolituus sp.]
MKKLLGISLMVLSASAFADSYTGPKGLTVGVGYSMGTFDPDEGSSFDLSAVQFRLGNELNQNFAVRFDYLIGTGEESKSIGGIDYKLELDSAFSLLLQPKLALNEKVEAYGLIGFTSASFTASASNAFASQSEENSDTSLSYGAGIGGNIKDNIGAYAEYVSYIQEDDYDFGGLNLGVTFGF